MNFLGQYQQLPKIWPEPLMAADDLKMAILEAADEITMPVSEATV